ncbi:MAG: hypothetical protein AAFX85_01075 [Pseudomonadota bacterium]
MSTQWSIYRKEALAARRERLAGEVVIVQPLSLKLLVTAFAALLLGCIGTLWQIPVTRSVQGVGTFPSGGASTIPLVVRAQDAQRLSPGDALVLHVSGLSSTAAAHGHIAEVATTPTPADSLSLHTLGATNTVRVLAKASSPDQTSVPSGAIVTATIVTERTTALQWLITAASKGASE